MKEKVYYIEGMHCASCELLVEKRILKEDGVKVVDASLGNGTVRVEYEKQVPPIGALNKWFKEDGYTFSDKKKKKEKELLLYTIKGKQGVHLNKPLVKRKLKTLGKVLIVFYILYLIERTGVAAYVTVTERSSLGVFFVFGLVAGVSSCAALVGGILLSLTKSWNDQLGYDASTKEKMTPHIYFHVGRVVSYGALGAFLGAVGQAVALENVTVYALITMAVSIVMLLIGLQMAGVEWAERFQFRMPKSVTRVIAGTSGEKSNRVPFAIGAGTVLLPCGFTLIAQGLALTSGSATNGALMLIAFVLGTMVPLLFIGLASVHGSKNAKRGRTFAFYTGVVLVIFALYNVNGQLNVLGLPSVNDVFASMESSEDPNASNTVISANGEQIVSMVAKGFSYQLTSPSTIQAGVPTKLVVDDQGMQGCGVFLAARGLIDGFVNLRYGENVIDLGSPKKGTYKITCSMGMVPPVTLRVE